MMRIKDQEIDCSDMKEFISRWNKDFGKVISFEDDWLVLENRDGKKFDCIVLGNTIFPFDFGENKTEEKK